MTQQQTFYLVDGLLFVSSENDSDGAAARRLRDAWSAVNNPNPGWPFAREDVGTTFMKTTTQATRFLGRVPGSDFNLFWAMREEVGDGSATIYVVDVSDPSKDRREALDYPEPLLTVLKKADGSDGLETMDCTTLREFVARNVDSQDPDPTLLYQIMLGRGEYALVAGDKIEGTIQAVEARNKGAGVIRNFTPFRFYPSHRNQLLRALEDHNQRVAPITPAP